MPPQSSSGAGVFISRHSRLGNGSTRGLSAAYSGRAALGRTDFFEADPREHNLGSFQRSTYALIHVVVAILGQPTDEAHVRRIFRENFVLLEQNLVLGPRHRVVGIAFGARV